MEPMTIYVVSLVEHDGHVRARARAVADQARISIEVRFKAQPGTSRADLWSQARNRVLMYLDPA